MSTITQLNTAREQSLSAYHSFKGAYIKGEKRVYAFVEGNDDISYYKSPIESFVDEACEVKCFSAGSKKKVIETYKVFDWKNFPKENILFFVDRDLSDFTDEEKINGNNFYITDGYSIENNIVTRATCGRILEETYKVSKLSSKELEEILDAFDKQLSFFKEEVALIMAWVILWRSSGKQCVFNKIKMKEIFIFDIVELKKKRDSKNTSDVNITEYIHRSCEIEYDARTDISDTLEKFNSADGKNKFIRGKYLMWFMLNFVKSICNNIHELSGGYSQPHKKCPSIGLEGAVEYFAPKARIPESLRNFLEESISFR